LSKYNVAELQLQFNKQGKSLNNCRTPTAA